MKRTEMAENLGCLIGGLIIQGIIEAIFLVAWLICRNKITLFLLGIGTVLLIALVIIYFVYLHYIKKEIKDLFSSKEKD